jgi:Cu(I)/Ag(I) efflux system protein CusF
MKKLLVKPTAALSFALLALHSHANPDGMKMDQEGMKMGSMEMSSSMGFATNEAEVKAVDTANKSITLKHGRIESKSVKMPPMTMTFPVEKADLLSQVKSGDKVKFTVENRKDQATVTALTVKK